MRLGEFIKQYRTDNNMTMEDFAKSANLTKGYISMLEKNLNPKTKREIVPSFATIQQIATAMSMSASDVIAALDDKQLISWGEEKTSDRPAPLQLTKKENKLISDFRSLSEQGQDYVIQTMDMVKDKYKIDSENMRLVADGSKSVSPLSDDDDAILSEPRNITTDILSELKDIAAHQRTPTSTK